MAEETPMTESDTAILDLFADYLSELEGDASPWEITRWYELVFCLLNASAERGAVASDLRHLTECLADLGLLDIRALAEVEPTEDHADRAPDPLIVSLHEILQRAGFSSTLARSTVMSICEAARTVHAKHDGKIQACLRKHGENLLEEISLDFAFSDRETTREALILWLQRVLNLPIPQTSPYLANVSKELGFTYPEALEKAEGEDLNVTLLDDALRLSSSRRLMELEEDGAPDEETLA